MLSPRCFKDNPALLGAPDLRNLSLGFCFYINLLRFPSYRVRLILAALSFTVFSSLDKKLQVHSIDYIYGKYI